MLDDRHRCVQIASSPRQPASSSRWVLRKPGALFLVKNEREKMDAANVQIVNRMVNSEYFQ